MTKLTEEEEKFIQRVKPLLMRFLQMCEENAIGTMVTEEGIKSKLKSVLIVGSPEEPILPCGMCRVAIERYGIKDASILCADLHLSKMKRFTISELYPEPYQD